MAKREYIRKLEYAADELRGTIRNWQPKIDLRQSLGTFLSQLDATTLSLKQSKAPVVPRETASAVWKLLEAIDIAAQGTGNDAVVTDVHVITTGVRQFYLTHGATIRSNGGISF